MAVEAVRVCPSCGSRNRPTWEFCPRCGETLDNVPTVAGQADTAVLDASAETFVETGAHEDVTEEGFPWGGLLRAVAIAAACGLALWFIPSQEKFERPQPTAAPEVPEQLPAPQKPGQESFDKGRHMLESGDVAGAIAALAQAVAEVPTDASYRHMYARALWTNRQWDAASVQLRAAVKLAPDVFRYRTELARVLGAAGKVEEAIREYEQAINVSPATSEALRTLATLHARAGHTEQAVSVLKRAIVLSPGDAIIQTELAYALERAGDSAGAIRAYEGALQRVPDATITRSLLAEALLKQGRNSEAVDILRTGLTRSPQSPLLHRSLGSVLERTGEIKEAIAAYREYARLAPAAPDATELKQRAAHLEKNLT